jgi:hypothetical protein
VEGPADGDEGDGADGSGEGLMGGYPPTPYVAMQVIDFSLIRLRGYRQNIHN